MSRADKTADGQFGAMMQVALTNDVRLYYYPLPLITRRKRLRGPIMPGCAPMIHALSCWSGLLTAAGPSHRNNIQHRFSAGQRQAAGYRLKHGSDDQRSRYTGQEQKRQELKEGVGDEHTANG